MEENGNQIDASTDIFVTDSVFQMTDDELYCLIIDDVRSEMVGRTFDVQCEGFKLEDFMKVKVVSKI